MSVQDILQANSRFLSKYRRIKIPKANGWAIVTCCDRKLSGLLEAAMGFRPGEAHVVRNAGNAITPFDNSIVRSLSMLVLKEGVKNIAVIGHTDCKSSIGTAELARTMESAKINREMAGSDLREFYGLTADPASNVRSTVDKIISSGLLPVGTNVYGLLIETTTGRLKSICGSAVEPVDIPITFDSSAYKPSAGMSTREIRQQKTIRGQEGVRQFTGRIETPREVRTPVDSVKVPVNIRTPVREVKVPASIRTPVREVKVPGEVTVRNKAVEMPRKAQVSKRAETPPHPADRQKTAKEALAPARPAQKRSRDLDSLRGQSLGSWNPAKRPRKPEPGNKKENKYCPRCGAEYYGHVENCADCRVKLVKADELHRMKDRQIKPVLGGRKRPSPPDDKRRRGYDRYSRRR